MLGAQKSTAEPEGAADPSQVASNDPISKPGLLRRILERIGVAPPSPGEVVYHGFISYSHGADGTLAPALQKGLHRFAKPWFRTRALHIFRDEESLSANPRLWNSITAALDGSEHLILLASPLAAASEWVGREAEYWCAHKDPSKILICLTDGELSWDYELGTVDTERTTALPAALTSAFEEEPRYIDLRWTREADSLSLGNPRWRDAVAEIAAPLHHMPKDQLSGEDVRQHRRTLRIARAAIATLLTLLIAAVVLAVVAYSQYRGAQARALAAQATANLATDPELALSEALKSTQISADSSGVQALRTSLATAPERITIQSGAGAGVQAAWNPAGGQIAVSGAAGRVELWSPSGRIEHVLGGSDSTSVAHLAYAPSGQWIAATHEDGEIDVWNALAGQAVPTAQLNAQTAHWYTGRGTLSSQTGGVQLVWSPAVSRQLIVYGGSIGAVVSFDATTGRAGTLITLPPHSSGVTDFVPSPDGTRQFLIVGSAGGSGTGYIFTPATNSALRVSTGPNMSSSYLACWTGDGKVLALRNTLENQDQNFRLWDAQTGRQLAVFPTPGTVTASACGQGPQLEWAATGTRGGSLTLHIPQIGGGVIGHGADVNYQLPAPRRYITVMASSRDGEYLATASIDGTARVWRARSGTAVSVLNDGSAVTSVAFERGDGLVLTTDQRGLARIWDAGTGQPVTALQQPPSGSTYPLGFIAGGQQVLGVNLVAQVGSDTVHPSGVHFQSVAALIWSRATGRLVDRIPLPSDVRLAQPDRAKCDLDVSGGYPCEIAPSVGISVPIPTANQWGLLGLAAAPDASRLAYGAPTGAALIDTTGHPAGTVSLGAAPTGLAFSARQLMVMSDRAIVLRDIKSGRTLTLPAASPPTDAEFSGDGRRLVVGYVDGSVVVWDTTTGTALARLRVDSRYVSTVRQLVGAAILRAQAVTRVAINADGSKVAAGTSWQTVYLWDVQTQRLVTARLATASVDQGFGAAGMTTAGGFNGPWPIVTLAFASGGSRLLATDMPYYAVGDTSTPITSIVLASRGTVVATYQSSNLGQGAIEPGDALSPDGNFLLGGTTDLGFESAGLVNTVYQTTTGVPMLGLGTADLAVGSAWQQWPSPAQPWTPDGNEVLAGEAIYACDACASVPTMQRTASTRLAWRKPLSLSHAKPPPGDPYR